MGAKFSAKNPNVLRHTVVPSAVPSADSSAVPSADSGAVPSSVHSAVPSAVPSAVLRWSFHLNYNV